MLLFDVGPRQSSLSSLDNDEMKPGYCSPQLKSARG